MAPGSPHRSRFSQIPERSGKAGTGQLVDRLGVAVNRGLGELDRRGEPLHPLLADSFESDPAKTLAAIRSLLSKEIHASVIDVTALHLEAVRQVSRAL